MKFETIGRNFSKPDTENALGLHYLEEPSEPSLIASNLK
jgi:hypothetical protein